MLRSARWRKPQPDKASHLIVKGRQFRLPFPRRVVLCRKRDPSHPIHRPSMKHSSTWYASILIVSALLLTAGRSASAASPNPTPSPLKTRETEQHQSGEKAPSNWWLIIFTGALAVVGILQFCAMTKQARSMRNANVLTRETLGAVQRQAKAAEAQVTNLEKTLVATEKAANAAKKSADVADKALTELERPWIFVQITKMEGWSRAWPANEPLMTITLRWYFRNFGRSPAFVLSGTGRLVLIGVLPDVPEYGPEELSLGLPIPQGLSNHRTAAIALTQQEHQNLLKGEQLLMFYGMAKYRGTFDPTEHESRWIAKLTVSRLTGPGLPEYWWTFSGPPAYTRYT